MYVHTYLLEFFSFTFQFIYFAYVLLLCFVISNSLNSNSSMVTKIIYLLLCFNLIIDQDEICTKKCTKNKNSITNHVLLITVYWAVKYKKN